MSDWDRLTPEQRAAITAARKAAGHTSVFEEQRQKVLQARTDAFAEACDWLKASGFFEASAALEAAAFERVD